MGFIAVIPFRMSSSSLNLVGRRGDLMPRFKALQAASRASSSGFSESLHGRARYCLLVRVALGTFGMPHWSLSREGR